MNQARTWLPHLLALYPQILLQQTGQSVLTDAIALSQPLFTFRMYERMS